MKKLLLFGLLTGLVLSFSQCVKHHDPPPPPPPKDTLPDYHDSLKMGLWGYYKFDNGSFGDSSGHHHDMRGVNGIKFGSDRSGNANNALAFDGINDFAVIDSGVNFPEGDFAVSFWMNAQKTIGGRIFNKANFENAYGASITCGFDDDNQTNKLVFGVTKDNNVCSTLQDINTATPLFNPTLISQNFWYHVLVEFVNGTEKVYINGQLTGTINTPNKIFVNCSTAPIYFGIWWLQDMRAFMGKLDDIRIYTRGLSDSEIKHLSDSDGDCDTAANNK